ncbi:F-box/WD repeat-containing protein 8 isoform 2-T2 [Pholidichthys leucotaenia]
MAEKELSAFRERWKQELTTKKEAQPSVGASSSASSSSPASRRAPDRFGRRNSARSPSRAENEACVGGGEAEEDRDQPEYVSIARSLLDGRTSPLLDRIQEERSRRKRRYDDMTNICSTSLQQQRSQSKVARRKDEELVDQLIQDLNEVNDIPFFDIELPYELALKIFQYLSCRELGRCAQNRVGSIRQLQFELGKVLCDVSSCDNFVLAGYTSGDVRLWDTLHWDSTASYLKANSLSATKDPRPHVSYVQVNSMVAAAAYEDGCVDLWSTETGGEPIHHYQIPGRIQALALSPDSPVLVSAAGPDVRLDAANDPGYWRTASQAQFPKTVESLTLVPGRAQQQPLAAVAAGEAVYLLDPGEEEPLTLHSVYGHPVTCLDASHSHVAFGVKRTGWAMHDGGNKIHIYSLETRKPMVCVGNSPGDFTCINLKDAPPHLLVCGNKDRRVRVFDLRAGSSVTSLYAHHLGVTSVQADNWKIVSGGGEGLVCVWEMRMGAKLWEMHNRHPVRHVHFNTSTLLTANIPDDKSPRGACITDDDLTAHRRHRGVICHYDFSEDALSQDHILPICRSDYTESYGYNYNISLAVPYDRLSGSHPSH